MSTGEPEPVKIEVPWGNQKLKFVGIDHRKLGKVSFDDAQELRNAWIKDMKANVKKPLTLETSLAGWSSFGYVLGIKDQDKQKRSRLRALKYGSI